MNKAFDRFKRAQKIAAGSNEYPGDHVWEETHSARHPLPGSPEEFFTMLHEYTRDWKPKRAKEAFLALIDGSWIWGLEGEAYQELGPMDEASAKKAAFDLSLDQFSGTKKPAPSTGEWILRGSHYLGRDGSGEFYEDDVYSYSEGEKDPADIVEEYDGAKILSNFEPGARIVEIVFTDASGHGDNLSYAVHVEGTPIPGADVEPMGDHFYDLSPF